MGLPAGVTASWASNTLTISGTPTVSGTFNYTIPLTGGCNNLSATGTIQVNPINTVSTASSTPALCINTVLTNINHTTTGATGIGTAIGLPAGVIASWASNAITISGTPTEIGTFNYTIPLTGGCNNLSAMGTIQVNPINTVSAASSAPTICLNTALTNITHTTSGATGIGTATGLPAGVTASWASNTITISGAPAEMGTFNYTIPLTGGCNNLSATGTIQVKQTVTVSSSSITTVLCINTAFTNLKHGTTGVTGIGVPSGLPEGVTVSYASNTISISGRPTEMGIFNYSIPLVGGCNDIMATGKISVLSENTVSAATNNLTTGSIYIPINTIVHKTTGAKGIGAVSGLPAGVTAIWMTDSIKISGTPIVSGTFNYVIPLTGGCGSVNATGTITITTDFNVSELQCGDYMIDNRGIYKGESYDGVIILPYKGGNGSFFTGLSIPSTGVSGLTMVLQPGKLATGNGSLELVIYGVPSDTGNVVFTLPFGTNSCTITLPVTNLIPQLSTLNCGSRILNPRGVGKETDYSGELTISYLGGNNGKINPISLSSAGVKGLTLESNAFTLNPKGGNLVFSLKGKPETAGLASFNLTVGDQTCQVMVNVINTEIQIPTYFTPNGDGKNDLWTIPALIFHEDAKVYIFDRTGRLLVEYSGSSQGWNGYIGQYPASAGDYWYVIQLNKEEVRKGNFTLIK
jgi:gliding motility-associated-like protein